MEQKKEEVGVGKTWMITDDESLASQIYLKLLLA